MFRRVSKEKHQDVFGPSDSTSRGHWLRLFNQGPELSENKILFGSSILSCRRPLKGKDGVRVNLRTEFSICVETFPYVERYEIVLYSHKLTTKVFLHSFFSMRRVVNQSLSYLKDKRGPGSGRGWVSVGRRTVLGSRTE